jgi:hypothetical protein
MASAADAVLVCDVAMSAGDSRAGYHPPLLTHASI